MLHMFGFIYIDCVAEMLVVRIIDRTHRQLRWLILYVTCWSILFVCLCVYLSLCVLYVCVWVPPPHCRWAVGCEQLLTTS